MKALSVRAPWWWAILHGKPVENRDWYTGVRGRIALHASKWWGVEDISLDWCDVTDMAAASGIVIPEPDWKSMRGVGGCIVGSVEIVDCVRQSSSPFFVGKYGFVLRNPVMFGAPVAVKGALGFFDVDEELMQGLML
jgi:hypothetical protein